MRIITQDNLRIRMNALQVDYGTKQSYICEQTKIHPSDLTRFKKNHLELTQPECERLDKFLSERGYGSDIFAFKAIVQGTFS